MSEKSQILSYVSEFARCLLSLCEKRKKNKIIQRASFIMFKFNFGIDEIQIEEGEVKCQSASPKALASDEVAVPFGSYSYEQLSERRLTKTTRAQVHFKQMPLWSTTSDQEHTTASSVDYVDSYRLSTIDEADDELARINRTHDLVAGQYEGGLKVWELSIDLARFIYATNLLEQTHEIAAAEPATRLHLAAVRSFFDRFLTRAIARVLQSESSGCSETASPIELRLVELGCGHALPSLGVVKYVSDMLERFVRTRPRRPDQQQQQQQQQPPLIHLVVYLQDFNEQIVDNVTFENVRQLIEQQQQETTSSGDGRLVKTTFRFVYGDWRDLHGVLPQHYFHLLLTSETIYNVNNYARLLDLFQHCMLVDKKEAEEEEAALILLSAKTYYFGCGGNLHEFLHAARSAPYSFNYSPNLLREVVVEHGKEEENGEKTTKSAENFEAAMDAKLRLLVSDSQKMSTRQEKDDETRYDDDDSKSRTGLSSGTTTATTTATSIASISKEIIRIFYQKQ